MLDAMAGAMVCGIAWTGNRVLLNLLPLEDYFLWLVRIHKPVSNVVGLGGENEEHLWDNKRVGVIGKGAIVV
jgi:hypothetical protein